jgi:hypothetical protein
MNEENQQELFKEMFEERAAIREFDGEQSRKDAEAFAKSEVKTAIFRCLIRQLLRWNFEGKRTEVLAWLDAVDVKGGRKPNERKLYADALNEQIKLGNKGEPGDWRS